MSGSSSEKTSVLASRSQVPAAQHPRAPEPTAKSVLERSGSSSVATVGEEATVLQALEAMAARDSGAVAVMSPAGLVGIFSERDHARNSLWGNRSVNDTPVAELMARAVATVAPSDGLGHCMAVMTERNVTHIAVVDRDRLLGLISQTDLLAARVAHHERIFRETETDQKLLFLRGTYSC